MSITGLGKLQRDLEEASRAFAALDGEIAEVRFDPHDPASVEGAISAMEQAVDGKVAAFSNNEMVKKVIDELKAKYREGILAKAASATLNTGDGSLANSAIDQSVLRQIEHAIADLQRADANTFDRHIKRLSKLIHTGPLDAISRELAEGIDIEAWLAAGHATQGGMVGSAILTWPNDGRQDLGIVIILVDRFADGLLSATDFSFDFYYHQSNSVAASLQKMVGQIIVPFGRDYIDYVTATMIADEAINVPAKAASDLTKVFIVHGHDGEARLRVARFIEKLGFEAIILHERPNKGRTIITKFREEAAGVGFAVVLMTPDDVGGKALAYTADAVKPRARQNVVFELGFFIGELGPERVAAMVKGEIERPSDFDGVVYISLDDGSWKADLARELEAAGYHVDWNKAMRA